MAGNVFSRQLKIVGNPSSMVIDIMPFKSGVGCGIFGCSGCLSLAWLCHLFFIAVFAEGQVSQIAGGTFIAVLFVAVLVAIFRSTEGERIIIKSGELTIRRDIWGIK